MLSEALDQLRYAVPVSLTTVCRVLVFTTDAAFVGHLGTNELAAANLCGTMFDAMLAFGFGTSMCLGTLCAQASGAKNRSLVDAYYFIGLTTSAVLSLLFIPLLIFATEPLLGALGMSADVRSLARTFMLVYAPRYFPVVIFQATRTYLNAQQITAPAMYVSIITTALNVALNYVFIYTARYGFVGAPLASLVTSTVQMAALLIYVYGRGVTSSWSTSLFTRRRMRVYTAMAIGTFLSSAADSWVFTAVVIMAGMIGTPEVAAQGILYNIWTIMWAVYFGFGSAMQTRVSHFLGNAMPHEARRAAWVGMAHTAALAALVAFVYWLTCPWACLLYTTDETLLAWHRDLKWLVVGSYAASTLSQTLLFVLDSCARPGTAAWIAVLASGLIQLPLSYVLTFPYSMSLRGLWWASAVCEMVRLVAAAVAVGGWVDWATESKNALKRSAAEEIDATVVSSILGDGSVSE